MKSIKNIINENTSNPFNRLDIKEAILNLPKNKEYKNQKINKVTIEYESAEEIHFLIDTNNFVNYLSIFLTGNEIECSGDITETAYSEIDELIKYSLENHYFNEWKVELDNDTDVEIILDEIINCMDNINMSSKMKFLYKIYNTLEKFKEQCEEDDMKSIFDEMLERYINIIK